MCEDFPHRRAEWPTAVGLVIAGGLTAVAPFIGDTYALVAMFFCCGAGSCSWALGATLTPPHLVKTLEAVRNVGGELAALVTGMMVDRTGSFDMAYVVLAVASLIGRWGMSL